MTHVSDCHCATCCPAFSSEGTPTAVNGHTREVLARKLAHLRHQHRGLQRAHLLHLQAHELTIRRAQAELAEMRARLAVVDENREELGRQLATERAITSALTEQLR